MSDILYDELNLNTVETSTNTSKKKIGRPKISKDPPLIEIKGKANKPLLGYTIVEVVYSDPTFFKKMFALYNSYDVTSIEWLFKPNSMEIRAKDHTTKIFIKTIFDVTKLNHYFCNSTICIELSRENLVNVLGSLSKSCNIIRMTLRKDDTSYFYINHVDSETSKLSAYNIPILKYTTDKIIDKTGNLKYQIQFTLTSKSFKEEVINSKKISNKLTIHKDESNKLWFLCDSTDNKLSYRGYFMDAKSIKLEMPSQIVNDTRTFSVGIDHIKPVSGYCVSNNVTISLSDEGYIRMVIIPDGKNVIQTNSVKVEVYVETIKFTQ